MKKQKKKKAPLSLGRGAGGEAKLPRIRQKIYVPTSLYIDRGEDDFAGGIATIDKIRTNDYLPKNDVNYLMVAIKERPGTLYNYRSLMKDQAKYKKLYGKQKAHPDPDYTWGIDREN